MQRQASQSDDRLNSLYSDISTELKPFGYEFFMQTSIDSLSPQRDIPVSPDYVIGPDDEIIILLWGRVNAQYYLVVDRDGNITIPQIGPLHVNGMRFDEMKKHLKQQASKIVGANINVTMGWLKSIQVFILGEAKRPGSYAINSFSTITNAILVAGGPNGIGSLRNIQLKRNNKNIRKMDFYDFLLKGDKSQDMVLQSGDVIFVPTVGPLVGINGNVKRPAIYELKEESRLMDVIEMAGGLTSTAFGGRVQVKRVVDNQFKTMFENDLIDIANNRDKNFTIKDGDLITLFPVADSNNIVMLEGAIKKAGAYAIEPGITKIADVIAKAGGLMYYAFHEVEITRTRVTQSGPLTELLNIDISKALEGDSDHNIPLGKSDFILVKTVPEGMFYKRKFAKDKFAKDKFAKDKFAKDKFAKDKFAKDKFAKDKSANMMSYQSVSIEGEVRFPGTYTISKGEKISSVINRAGGYTDKAYLRGAVFTRDKIKALQQTQIIEMARRLERNLLGAGATETATSVSADEAQIKKLQLEQQKQFMERLKSVEAKGRMVIYLSELNSFRNSKYDIEIEANDSIYIPTNPHSIQIIGSVNNETAFIYDEQINISGYINMAGGYQESADQKRMYVLKVDGTAVVPGNGSTSFDWDSDANRWERGVMGLEPGDTIVVPEKLEKIAWMRHIKDITQIMFQIATTAGVLIVAF
jgi:protein involved in polysaccharide export with SLBB domain